ncbi:MAG: hypothetical protein ABS84_14510 [Rubrivivax sp. SCN 71-131]|nr:MAG: hypothetical protein ABS84_14510 [Rubrivivax sp. SCN 71-131]
MLGASGVGADPLALLQALAARRSVDAHALRPPAPPPEVLQRAAELTLGAPDHQGLRPVRFVHVGSEERAALGELFARAAAATGRDASGVINARERAFTGPGLLAVVVRIRDDVPDVPPYEQWLSAGAALMILLQALHLQGYGAKVLGGRAARSEVVRRAFCTEGEQLACWIITGTRDPAAEEPKPPDMRRELLTDWSPAPS